MGAGFGREWIPVYVWLNSCAFPLKLSKHCSKKKKKKLARDHSERPKILAHVCLLPKFFSWMYLTAGERVWSFSNIQKDNFTEPHFIQSPWAGFLSPAISNGSITLPLHRTWDLLSHSSPSSTNLIAKAWLCRPLDPLINLWLIPLISDGICPKASALATAAMHLQTSEVWHSFWKGFSIDWGCN